MEEGSAHLIDADDEGFLSSEEVKSEEECALPGHILAEGSVEGISMIYLPLSSVAGNHHEMDVVLRDDGVGRRIDNTWSYMVRCENYPCIELDP